MGGVVGEQESSRLSRAAVRARMVAMAWIGLSWALRCASLSSAEVTCSRSSRTSRATAWNVVRVERVV